MKHKRPRKCAFRQTRLSIKRRLLSITDSAALRQAPVAERPVALPPVRERIMPITPFLDGLKFDPEAKRVMGVAFEMARIALRLADRGDVASEIMAKRIIKLAEAGERNPDLLCEIAVKEFRERLEMS